ncbi:unnamed protein product [Lupinus luteus]|uniref:Uncharacterized protein n=1 Tax=Lupinus luteus TaxID=3873 RepID=A0AAV1XIZ3_LUPLU
MVSQCRRASKNPMHDDPPKGMTSKSNQGGRTIQKEKEAPELVINLEIDKDVEFQLQNLETIHQSPIERDSEVDQETAEFDQVAASDICLVGRLWGDDELTEPEEEFTTVLSRFQKKK